MSWGKRTIQGTDYTFHHLEPFTFIVDGKRVELVPRDLWNARAAWAPKTGLGVWSAVRHQGIRPYTRRNSFYAPAFLVLGRASRVLRP